MNNGRSTSPVAIARKLMFNSHRHEVGVSKTICLFHPNPALSTTNEVDRAEVIKMLGTLAQNYHINTSLHTYLSSEVGHSKNLPAMPLWCLETHTCVHFIDTNFSLGQ